MRRQWLAVPLLALWWCVVAASLDATEPASPQAQHPDLPGLLALKSTICGANCSELSSWASNGTVCGTFDGVYCGWVGAQWRVVGVQLQLEVGRVAFNNSAMALAGVVQQVQHLQELELLCVKQQPPPAPQPSPAPPGPVPNEQQQQHLPPIWRQHQQQRKKKTSCSRQSPQPTQDEATGSMSDSPAISRATHSAPATLTAPGDLPASWFLAFPRLSHLRVTGCGAGGVLHRLPLTATKQLASVVLSRNRLRGSLPAELAQLQALSVLDLSANQLQGTLPAAWAGLGNLQYMYLAHNNLSGPLPCEFTALSLKLADLSGNRWSRPSLVGSQDSTAVRIERRGDRATSSASGSRGSASAGGGSTPFGSSLASATAAAGLRAPTCWLRRFCYDEGAYICLARTAKHPQTAGCASYVYGASDLHIDAANQCDHGGGHLAAIPVLFAGFLLALLLTWLHHCRLLRRMQHEPSSRRYGQQQQQQQPGGLQAGPWQQRQWLISGPAAASRPLARGLSSGGSSSQLAEPLLQPPAALPLLYCPPSSEAAGAGYASPLASSAEGLFQGGVHIGTPDALLPSALTTPSAGAISIRPAPGSPGGGAGNSSNSSSSRGISSRRGGGGIGSLLGRRGGGSGADAAAAPHLSASRGLQGSKHAASALRGTAAAEGAAAAPGYDSDGGGTPSSAGGGSMGPPGHTTVALSGSWLAHGYCFAGNEPLLPPWAGGVARLLAAAGVSSPEAGGAHGGRGSAGCCGPSMLLPLVSLLLDTATNLRLLLLWGVAPLHVKLWPSYVLLGLLCAPHLLVGVVVHIRLLAAASLPPALKAAAPGLLHADVLPPGAGVIVALYSGLFVAPAWAAYPAILVLLAPCVALTAVLGLLTPLLAACGLASLACVQRYILLVQGCAALTQAPGSAVLLTVLFLMGNVPLEWAFLSGALYYVTLAADLVDMCVALWLRLESARGQQALALAALPAVTGQRWT